jgi:hypothetical protein
VQKLDLGMALGHLFGNPIDALNPAGPHVPGPARRGER